MLERVLVCIDWLIERGWVGRDWRVGREMVCRDWLVERGMVGRDWLVVREDWLVEIGW